MLPVSSNRLLSVIWEDEYKMTYIYKITFLAFLLAGCSGVEKRFKPIHGYIDKPVAGGSDLSYPYHNYGLEQAKKLYQSSNSCERWIAKTEDAGKDIPEACLSDGKYIRPKLAIALSGGGLRASSFSIGVLKGLEEEGVLRNSDIVTCASGGCYTLSWFYMQQYLISKLCNEGDDLGSHNNNISREERRKYCDTGKKNLSLSDYNYLFNSTSKHQKSLEEANFLFHHDSDNTTLLLMEGALKTLTIPPSWPVHWIANGLFDADTNRLSPLGLYYRNAIERDFHTLCIKDEEDKNDECKSSDDFYNLRYIDGVGAINAASSETIHGIYHHLDKKYKFTGKKLPYPIFTATSDITKLDNYYELDDHVLPEESVYVKDGEFSLNNWHLYFGNQVYEFSPDYFGSDEYGKFRMFSTVNNDQCEPDNKANKDEDACHKLLKNDIGDILQASGAAIDATEIAQGNNLLLQALTGC